MPVNRTKKHLTMIEKAHVLIKYCKDYYTRKIKTMAVDKQNRPVGRYRQELINAYNKGTLKLPPEIMQELKDLKILSRPKKEYEEMSKKYNIPANKIKHIERDYGNIENLVEKKKNSGFASEYWMEYYGIKNYQAILLSSRDTTVREKAGYVRFAINCYPQLENNILGVFINKEYLDEVLSMLTEQERYIVESIYGINGKTKTSIPKMSEKINISIHDINEILKKARILLSKKDSAVFRLQDLQEEKNRLTEKAEIANTQGNSELYNQLCRKIEHTQALIDECNNSFNRFIQYEDLFNDNEIIMASGKSHLGFTFDENTTKRSTPLQDRKESKQEKEKEVCDLQAQIDVQDSKEQKLIEILDIKEKDKELL